MSFDHASFHRGSDWGRGRGRGGGFWRGGRRDDDKAELRSRQNAATTTTPPKLLGPAIDNINIKTLMTEEDAPTIKNIEYVASYNWLHGKSPVILVPGKIRWNLSPMPDHQHPER